MAYSSNDPKKLCKKKYKCAYFSLIGFQCHIWRVKKESGSLGIMFEAKMNFRLHFRIVVNYKLLHVLGIFSFFKPGSG